MTIRAQTCRSLHCGFRGSWTSNALPVNQPGTAFWPHMWTQPSSLLMVLNSEERTRWANAGRIVLEAPLRMWPVYCQILPTKNHLGIPGQSLHIANPQLSHLQNSISLHWLLWASNEIMPWFSAFIFSYQSTENIFRYIFFLPAIPCHRYLCIYDGPLRTTNHCNISCFQYPPPPSTNFLPLGGYTDPKENE